MPVKTVRLVDSARSIAFRRAESLSRSNPSRALLVPGSGQTATMGT